MNPASKSFYCKDSCAIILTVNGDFLGFATELQASPRLRLPHADVFFPHDHLVLSDYQQFV